MLSCAGGGRRPGSGQQPAWYCRRGCSEALRPGRRTLIHGRPGGLGGLRRVGLHEAAVAVGQVDYEAVGLPLAADDHQGLPEVALGVARLRGQGHEHLSALTAIFPHVVLDRSVSSVESVFVPEPLEDALGRVALLPGTPVIVLQDPVYDAGEGLQLGLPGRGLSAITRRGRIGQHLAHGVPVQTEHPGLLPVCSSYPPSPPGEPVDIRPPCTSITPSMGSATTL